MPEDLGTKPEEFASKEQQLADELKHIKQDREIEIDREKGELAAIENLRSVAIEYPFRSAERQALETSAQIMEAKFQEKKHEKKSVLDDVEAKLESTNDKREINTLRAESDFNRNEEAYKQQAVAEAQTAGKDILYPAITGPVAPPNLEGAPENDQPNSDQLKRELDQSISDSQHLLKEIRRLAGQDTTHLVNEYHEKNAEVKRLQKRYYLALDSEKRSAWNQT